MTAQNERRGKNISLKARVNYYGSYSTPFTQGEGLVQLFGVGGLQELKSHFCSNVPKGRHIHITRKS